MILFKLLSQLSVCFRPAILPFFFFFFKIEPGLEIELGGGELLEIFSAP